MTLLTSLAACATGWTQREAVTPAERYLRLRDSLEALASRERDADRAPQIRLHQPLTRDSYRSYVDVAFSVERDAYALVVAVDLEDRIRVLFPDSPRDTAFVQQHTPARLQRFFPGFGHWRGVSRYHFLRGGMLVAVASARPLQLERLMDESGDWDEEAIARLLDRSTAVDGARELGRAVTLVGQKFTTDHESFSGRRNIAYAGTLGRESAFGDCSFAFGNAAFDLAPGAYALRAAPLVRYFVIGRYLYAQYLNESTGCGTPAYSVPVLVGPAPQPPVSQPVPRLPGDTTPVPSPKDSVTRLVPRFRPPHTIPLDEIPDEGRVRLRAEGETPAAHPAWAQDESPVRSAPVAETREGERAARVRPAEPREEPVGADTRRTEPRREPRSEESPRGEPRRVEPPPEPPRSEPPRSEPPRSEPVSGERVRSEPVRSEPVRKEPDP
jgi:hypothetical protein